MKVILVGTDQGRTTLTGTLTGMLPGIVIKDESFLEQTDIDFLINPVIQLTAIITVMDYKINYEPIIDGKKPKGYQRPYKYHR